MCWYTELIVTLVDYLSKQQYQVELWWDILLLFKHVFLSEKCSTVSAVTTSLLRRANVTSSWWFYSNAHINMLHVDTYTHIYNPPMRGTESDVAGMISATRSMKTVSERSTVMPWDRDREGERENMSIYIMMWSGPLVYEISPVITYIQYVISYVLMTTTIYQLLAPLPCLK